MLDFDRISAALMVAVWPLAAAEVTNVVPTDPQQALERTCFQTSQPWSGSADLRSDVALVYGIDKGLPGRIETWREHGYRIHVMTGVAWGNYQDYYYGRWDGISHEDEAQTDRAGNKIGHGGDVYYMCPGTNYGKYLCVGVQRALDAGAEAIHLEEPEFWVRGGYSEGFKREWRSYYGEDWQPPHSSPDAQWRASKLKYFLYRRALQQVFDYVQEFNHRTGKKVRCYVPTHSLLNYAHWQIVSPESSLARLNGCDGYIAQVWTGTSRTPNVYRGQLRERTFETAFLEYGAMQNLVRSTGRGVWYLNDPIEDNPNHDWEDYRVNWESTLVASLFQPEVWQFEVAPWPERIFAGRYPRRAGAGRRGIPPAYATELQTVMNTLNDMKQERIEWDAGSQGIGVLISDSLMFQRGQPDSSDSHMGHVYGMALPLLKRGMPVTPVQLENVTVPGYLKGFNMLLLTYRGQKPLSPEVHKPLADWVKDGGALVVVDDDGDAYNRVRDWWNSDGNKYVTPREHLFEACGLKDSILKEDGKAKVGKGTVRWVHENPTAFTVGEERENQFVSAAKTAATDGGIKWRETNYLLLRRGPYLIGAGLDESVAGEPKGLKGHFINLFDPELRLQTNVALSASARLLLLDLDSARLKRPTVLASACKAVPAKSDSATLSLTVEGVASTPAIVLISSAKPAKGLTLDGQDLKDFEYSSSEQLLRVRFENQSKPRELRVTF
jgi:hypothetical protein